MEVAREPQQPQRGRRFEHAKADKALVAKLALEVDVVAVADADKQWHQRGEVEPELDGTGWNEM